MKKIMFLFGVLLLFAGLFWLWTAQNQPPHSLLAHRFAGEYTTQRAEALYPEARDVVTRLDLDVAALDEMSMAGSNPWLDRYQIEIQVDVARHTATARQKLILTNHTGYAQKELYFHIYPNAFRDEDTAPALLGMAQSYPNGFSAGELKLRALRSEAPGVQPTYSVIGDTSSVLKLVLGEVLAEGQSLTLHFEYELVLPETLERFGYFEGFYNFAHFYPILAVFDDSGWNLDPYIAMGDPFYSEIADYEVMVSIDKAYEVASSGKLLETIEGEDLKTYRFKAANIRSFCFVAYDGWDRLSTEVGATELISYVSDARTAAPYVEAAAGMLKALQDYLGPYPYPSLSFVESAHISAMEWPGLIIVPSHAMQGGTAQDWALEASAHEVAHQYFYGLVGNDQFDEAWLDEGFATYLNYVWHPVWGPFNSTQNEQAMQEVLEATSHYPQYEGVLVKPLDQFTDSDPYWNVYKGGALFLNKLRLYLGEESFEKGLRTYFERYKYKLADSDEFFSVMAEVSGQDLRDFVRTQLKYELKP